jgi:hypothetical protein
LRPWPERAVPQHLPSRSPISRRLRHASAHHGQGVPFPCDALITTRLCRVARNIATLACSSRRWGLAAAASASSSALALQILSSQLERLCNSSGSSSPRLPSPCWPSSWRRSAQPCAAGLASH